MRAPRKPVLYTRILQGVVPACVRKGLIIMEGWLMVLYIHIFFFSVSCSSAIVRCRPVSLHHTTVSSLFFCFSTACTNGSSVTSIILRKPFGGKLFTDTLVHYKRTYINPACLPFCKGGSCSRRVYNIIYLNDLTISQFRSDGSV